MGNACVSGEGHEDAKSLEKEPAAPQVSVRQPPKEPGRVPIYVMLPLDWMSDDGEALRSEAQLRSWCEKLKSAEVRGVMGDVWWGLCEPEPQKYRFGAAKALCNLLKSIGLELQAVMSFHKCGGNVGDAVTFPIPEWALKPAKEKGLLYKSKSGTVSEDCLSLSADNQSIFPVGTGGAYHSGGDTEFRTALHCYRDYIAAFCKACGNHIGTTVIEIQVGMGPCGELRYPSYMMSEGWDYPGVGIFMCYDDGMQKMMKDASVTEPPGLPSEPKGFPDDCDFFKATSYHENFATLAETKDSFCVGVGPAFLEWYTQLLVNHGEAVVGEAIAALQDAGCAQVKPERLSLSVKVAGIHWHTLHASRATEACAGYNCSSSPLANAYLEIAAMLQRATLRAKRPVMFNFTCLEMNNWSGTNSKAASAPEDLITQVRRACITHHVALSGENALEFDLATGAWAFDQMKKQLRGWSNLRDRMHGLTILRLKEEFVSPPSLKALREFVCSFPESRYPYGG